MIDLLIKREPFYSNVAAIFENAYKQKDIIVISNLSIVNAHYVVKRLGVQEKALRTALQNICTSCEIAPLNQGITMKSLLSNFKDFEDATQYFCALENSCDIILTENKKDFKFSTLPVMSSAEFITDY